MIPLIELAWTNPSVLVYILGVLVDAMRKGYWVILDELNLAPTDVLEALNRLLDDNRLPVFLIPHLLCYFLFISILSKSPQV